MMAEGGETAGGEIRKTGVGWGDCNKSADGEHQGQGGISGNIGEENIPRKTDKGQKSGQQGGDRNSTNKIKQQQLDLPSSQLQIPLLCILRGRGKK